jgi:hypothetical protein
LLKRVVSLEVFEEMDIERLFNQQLRTGCAAAPCK